ncbi:UPF0176 protein [Croceifilum oryzae]|uniref:tRNA uridine(34) hydroxylase n=1 Tax=Croceifilum oryzae TaxID=1553429 RepID=A0AAJ1TDU6_9BACL|nr:rhodanese-related sulfurtransferase [Croceifilum oryzae]MDQ0417003.1 UPF0176 protein [Croceifilum oryzae]
MSTSETYHVLLYYKYVKVEDPVSVADEHRALCQQLGLKGRILISPEGINGTCSGTIEATNQYIEAMNQHPLFSGIFFKADEHEGHAFKKLFVRAKKELVTWRFENDFDPNELTGKHLSPAEFKEHLLRDDVIVIDGRNDYEYDLGHFRGAIRPGVETSRDFPEWIRENLSQFKDKKVISYCTGGIRCEKLTGFLLQEGFQDVSQLHGGVVNYSQDPETKGELWDGQLYVFDERISVPVNHVDPTVVGKCHHCKIPAETYINCEYDLCHHQHLVCLDCVETYNGYCKKECEEQDLIRKEA